MVAQASWLDSDDLEPDTGSEDAQGSGEGEELWHVMLAPDEVKVLTLEQLDDLYRLDIIDAGTPVWQPDTMRSWTTLGAVAGIDDDAGATPTTPRGGTAGRGALPSTSGRTANLRAVPPPAGPPSSAPQGRLERYDHAAPSTQSVTPPMLHVVRPSAPPPAAQTARRAPATVPPPPVLKPSAPPPAPASYMAPRRAAAPAPSSYPPPVASAYDDSPASQRNTLPPRSRSGPAPIVATTSLPETLRPMAADVSFARRRSGGPGIEGWLVGLAAVAGLALTLYRNDTLRTLARDAGREPLFAQLEARLGGPSFGTPRAIEQLRGPPRSAEPAAAIATPLPAVASTAQQPASPREPSPTQASPREASPSLSVAALTHAAETAKGATRLDELGPASSEAKGQIAAKAPAAQAQAKAAPRVASRAAPARAASPKSGSPSGASAAPVKRSKKHAASMYDPLNPEL